MSITSSPGADVIAHVSRQTAISGPHPLSLVEKLVRFQFMAAAAATSKSNTVELSGIGYLYCSPSKTARKLLRAQNILSCYQKKLDTPLSAVRSESLHKRIESIKIMIQIYEDRLERSRAGSL
jgi:hypothetical protein